MHTYGNLSSKSETGNRNGYLKERKNTQRLFWAYQWHQEIKTIPRKRTAAEPAGNEDNMRKYNSIQNAIKQAEEIIIIGFGFDRFNMDILGFGHSYDDYFGKNGVGLFNKDNNNHPEVPKIIKYLDYKGKMNGLYSQLQECRQHSEKICEEEAKKSGQIQLAYRRRRPFILIRSTANSIVDAYQSDFKIQLITR